MIREIREIRAYPRSLAPSCRSALPRGRTLSRSESLLIPDESRDPSRMDFEIGTLIPLHRNARGLKSQRAMRALINRLSEFLPRESTFESKEPRAREPSPLLAMVSVYKGEMHASPVYS